MVISISLPEQFFLTDSGIYYPDNERFRLILPEIIQKILTQNGFDFGPQTQSLLINFQKLDTRGFEDFVLIELKGLHFSDGDSSVKMLAHQIRCEIFTTFQQAKLSFEHDITDLRQIVCFVTLANIQLID